MKPLDVSENAPWKQRYRAPAIRWAFTAKNNPSRGIVCTNRDGIYQLYAWETDTGSLRQITYQPAGMVVGMIDADGQYIYFHRDEQGNEIGHYVRVPFAGGEPEDITPAMPLYASTDINTSKTGGALGFYTAGPEGFQVYISRNGETPRRIFHSERLTQGMLLSADGSTAVIHSTDRSGTLDGGLLAFDVATGDQIAELWDGEGTNLNAWVFSNVTGDERLVAMSSQSGYERPLIWNPRTGERHDLPIDDIPGDVTAWGFSPDGFSILLCQLHQAEYRLYRYDVASQKATRLNHPEGVWGGFLGGQYTADGDILVTWEDPAHPPQLVVLDGQSGAQKRVALAAGDVPAGLGWRSVMVTGAKGEPVQMWVATPKGDGPFPTILHTHGGPTAVMTQSFFPGAQSWLDHGFAFCSVNYHGSITFGKAFEKSLWGNLGQFEVDDMAAAYHWLVENGVAQADSVLLTGGSYGGYLTLQALGKAPELWAGGMAVVAIADWKLMYEDQAETLRGYQRALFGGTPDETPEVTRSASPITYAEQVRAPVLVIQGANDTRCPARQMRAYEEKLLSLDKPIKVHWFDAGHGSRAAEQQIEQQEMMLRFAYQVLG